LDPAIGDLANVYLYDIDDLHSIVDSNLAERRKEAVKIEGMIAEGIAAFEQWYKMIGMGPVINALQTKANRIHEDTLESILNKLPELDERQVKVIRKLTKSIVTQMLRDPIQRVKEMAGEKKGDEALELFTQFFALEALLEEKKEAERLETKERSAPVHVRQLVSARADEPQVDIRGLAGAELLGRV
jgi:glutamyl-tRNA reductase